MVPVKVSTSDRLTDAALALMDAARLATHEAPDYAPGKPMIAQSIALAVQAVFLADRWNDGGGEAVAVERDETMARVRGLGQGVGAAITALQNKQVQDMALTSFMGAMLPVMQSRREARARGTRI